MCGPNLLALWVVLLALVRYESMGAPSPDPISTDIFNHQKIVPRSTHTEISLYNKLIDKGTTEKLLKDIERAMTTNPQFSEYKQYAFLLVSNSGVIQMLVNDFGLSVIYHVTKRNPGVVEKLVESFGKTHSFDKESLNTLRSGVIKEFKFSGVVKELKILKEKEEFSLVKQRRGLISEKHVSIRRRSLGRGAVGLGIGIGILLAVACVVTITWVVFVHLSNVSFGDIHSGFSPYSYEGPGTMLLVLAPLTFLWVIGVLVAGNVNTNTEDSGQVSPVSVSQETVKVLEEFVLWWKQHRIRIEESENEKKIEVVV